MTLLCFYEELKEATLAGEKRPVVVALREAQLWLRDATLTDILGRVQVGPAFTRGRLQWWRLLCSLATIARQPFVSTWSDFSILSNGAHETTPFGQDIILGPVCSISRPGVPVLRRRVRLSSPVLGSA